jgi:hypothetical protein
VRDGRCDGIPFQHPLAGDVMTLSAGGLIPADVQVIAAKDLLITQLARTDAAPASRSAGSRLVVGVPHDHDRAWR